MRCDQNRRRGGRCGYPAPAGPARGREPLTQATGRARQVGHDVAADALLEREGEPTLLVKTQGFRVWLAYRLPEPPALSGQSGANNPLTML